MKGKKKYVFIQGPLLLTHCDSGNATGATVACQHMHFCKHSITPDMTTAGYRGDTGAAGVG